MTEDERKQVIEECIQYLKDRPGRKAINTLIAFKNNQKSLSIKVNKPNKDHPWRSS